MPDTGNVVLYGPDQRPLPPSTFITPWDSGPGTPFPVFYGSRSPLTWEYPLAVNAVFTPRTDEGLPQFKTLRAVADTFDLLAIIIFNSLKRLSARELGFISREESDSTSAKKKLAPDIDKAEAFWDMPDKKNRYTWRSWIIGVMDEAFVTDGIRLAIEKTYDGTPSLRQIMPEMMKPVMDNEGDIAAWQQVVRGMPRTGYSTYTADEILAPCYHPQIDSVYGKSHVECLLLTVDIGIQKLLLEKARFTESTVPPGFLFAPDSWSPGQIEEYANMVERIYAGNMKRRAQFMIAPGSSKGYTPVQDQKFDKDHEEVLIARLCALFGEPRSVFVDSQTRGGSHTTQESGEDTGLNANIAFILDDIVNPFLWRDTRDGGLGLTNIKATFTDESTREKLPAAQVWDLYIKNGTVSPDEVRDKIGFEGPSPATLDAQKAEEMAAQGKLPTGEPMQGLDQAGPAGQKQAAGKGAPSGGTDSGQAAPGNSDNLAKEERAQWKRFALRRLAKDGAGAPFRAQHIPPLEQWAIRKALQAAHTPAEVSDAMSPPTKRLTEARKKRLMRQIQGAAADYLDASLKAAKEHAPHFLKKDALPFPEPRGAFDVFAGLLRSLLAAVWGESGADAATIAKAGFSFDHFDAGADRYARTRAGELITQIDVTTRQAVSDLTHEAIVEGWGPQEFASNLEELGVFGEARAEMIARTEVAIAQNRGQLSLLKELDINKVRVYDGDYDEECAAANGQVWDIDEADANPIEHPNCERAFSPLTDEEAMMEEAA